MTTETTSAPPATPSEAATFSAEYVRELRGENKTYRIKAQDLEAKATAAEQALATVQTEAEARISAATEATNERILRSELKAVALKAGMIDIDGLKLADLSTVKLTDAGDIEGAEAMLDALKLSKPYLFSSTQTSTTTTPPPPPIPPTAKRATEMTNEEYATARKQFN